MTSTEARYSVSAKTFDGTLVTVRGESPAELAANFAGLGLNAQTVFGHIVQAFDKDATAVAVNNLQEAGLNPQVQSITEAPQAYAAQAPESAQAPTGAPWDVQGAQSGPPPAYSPPVAPQTQYAPQAPAVASAPAAPVSPDIPICAHGVPRSKLEGISKKTGRPYSMWVCRADVPREQECKPSN